MELCHDSSDEEPVKAASPTANTRPASTVSPPSAGRAQQPKKTRRPRGGLDPVQQASHPISAPLGSRRGAVQQRLDQEARAAEAATAKLASKLVPFGGLCWWCLCPAGPGHDPDARSECPAKPSPDMSDFEQQKPERARIGTRARADAAEPERHGREQTLRSQEEQAQHEKDYQSAHKQRSRQLKADAQAAATDFIQRRTEPLRGDGPFGQFTVAYIVAIEFALNLLEHLSPAQLATEYCTSWVQSM